MFTHILGEPLYPNDMGQKELAEKIGQGFREIRKRQLDAAKQKAYLHYEENGIESLCEYVSVRQDVVYPSQLKNAILVDEESPLSETEKVFLATYLIDTP